MDLETNQEQYLEEGRTKCKEEGFYMRRAVESQNLRQALIHSARMLNQLSTALLSPRNYYILFMQVFDELNFFEKAIREEWKRGRSMKDLYQQVQYCQQIIPRLYLLITVGSIYIETMEIQAKEILQDLIEMTKGVQHPVRGLFLRYYFLKICKSKFPDTGNEYDGDGGNVSDSIGLIMNNLKEMNRLWIRIKSIRQFKKVQREKQRQDLKVCVGENIVRLANLEGITGEVYQETVLPALIKLIKKTKDFMSQQYLLDCIITAFPDEFHLHNLETILETCTQGINAKCDVKIIFIRLMERLADYAANSEDAIVTDLDNQLKKKYSNQEDGEEKEEGEEEEGEGKAYIFEMFKSNIDNIIETKGDEIPINNLLELQVAFLKFSIYCYPDESDNVNLILQASSILCEKKKEEEFGIDVKKNIVQLLTLPLETMGLTILSMEDYPKLMEYLPFDKRKDVAVKICEAVVSLQQVLGTTKITKQLLKFLKPLLTEDDESVEVQPYEFEEEQQLIAKVIHLVNTNAVKTTFKCISLFKEQFLKGTPQKQRFTLPACFFAHLKLAYEFKAMEDAGEDSGMEWEKYFDLCRDIIVPLKQIDHELTYKLYLQLAIAVDMCDVKQELSEYNYDIASEPLIIYEEELSDTQVKKDALVLCVAFWNKMKNMEDENFDTLVSNTCQYGSKLLRKSDQCLTILQCTHLWINLKHNKPKNIFSCLKRCSKLATISFKSNNKNVILFVHILNKMLYYLNMGVETVEVDFIQQCLYRIYQLAEGLDSDKIENYDQMKCYLNQTVQYINSKKSNDDEGNVYDQIDVNPQTQEEEEEEDE